MSDKITTEEELELLKKELLELTDKYNKLKIDYNYLEQLNNNLKNDVIINTCMDKSK